MQVLSHLPPDRTHTEPLSAYSLSRSILRDRGALDGRAVK